MKFKQTTLTMALTMTLSINACAANNKKDIESSEMAEKGPVEIFMQGCSTELETYCKNVTPGDNRLLACIYAHSDKLSGRCEFALYEASAQLERAIASLRYAVSECSDDLEKYCADVEVGEGRLLACLDSNEKSVSTRCKQALKDVGLNQ